MARYHTGGSVPLKGPSNPYAIYGREPGHEKTAVVELGTSAITIKMHRSKTIRKMRAESFADLVKMAETLAVPATGS